MSNLSPFVDRFFDELALAADLQDGHSYKAFLRGAVTAFLEHETPETAFAVYRAFFDSYRITLPGKSDPFIDLVDILRSYEATAATLIDKQRDHFIHAVNVFLTGLSIYAENPAYRHAFESAVPEKNYIYAYQTPHEEFFFRWGVASLFHDVGYPVEIVGHQINRFIRMVADADGNEVKVKAQIRFENFSELNHIREVVPKRPFTRAYYDAYESCSYIDLLTPNDLLAHRIHQTLDTDLMETKKAVDRFVDDMAASGFIDHGYYSAMIILKWYGYAIQMAGDHPERFYWPILDSATAILLHNYYRNVLQKKPFDLGPMDPKKNPVAYLLILCDELQEWNREAHGIITRTFTLADTVHLSLRDGFLSATYVTRHGRLPEKFSAEKVELLRGLLDLGALFPRGFEVDAESLDSFETFKPQLREINARPLLKDIELLAIAIHARYCEKQLQDHPDRPLDYPDFSQLPDDLKYSNLRQAQGICDRLEQVGYRLGPKGGKDPVEVFPPELLEFMAELEHEAWMQERLSRGWKLGERNAAQKTSPYLVPYDQLSEEIKDYDRDAIRNIPALAARVGMAVYAN
ncbi:MAG: hypothetical protein IKG32_03530 [Clostridia bacterium]|nr:hypothetical protein [Clostridia bacterium]